MARRERGTGGLFRYKNSKNWYAKYYDADGVGHQTTTGTAVKQEAQDFLRKLLDGRDRGETFTGDLKKIFYSDLRKTLIDSYVLKGNKSLQTTADGEESIFGLSPLDEFFGYESEEKQGLSLAQITEDRIMKFVHERRAAVTNSTVNGSLRHLRHMLALGKKKYRLHSVPDVQLLKENPPRKGFLKKEKFDELIKHLSDDLKPAVTFLYYCGGRRGEVFQIRWSQVDLDGAVIRLEDEQVKNSEGRTVPLPDVLIEMLRPLDPTKAYAYPNLTERFVFPISDYDLRKGWDLATAAVGLGGGRKGGLIVHDLRRSAARNLRKAGVPESVIMKIGGWKTRSVFDRYNIVDEEDVVEAMRQLEGSHRPAKSLASKPPLSESLVRPRRRKALNPA